MALFLGRGFAAWSHAWTQAMPDKSGTRPSSVTEASEVVRLPGQVHTQMVSALAGMVLDALRAEAA